MVNISSRRCRVERMAAKLLAAIAKKDADVAGGLAANDDAVAELVVGDAGAGEAGGRKQEAGSRRQEAGSRRQEAGSRRQEAGGRRWGSWVLRRKDGFAIGE
jgi:hypothetical protein